MPFTRLPISRKRKLRLRSRGASIQEMVANELREAKREAERISAEVARLETVVRSRSYEQFSGMLKEKSKPLHGWVVSLLESILSIDFFDVGEGDMNRLADEYKSAISALVNNVRHDHWTGPGQFNLTDPDKPGPQRQFRNPG